MKVPWKKTNCTKALLTCKEVSHLEAKISKEVAWVTFVCLGLLFAAATASYEFWRFRHQQDELQPTEDELRFLVLSVVEGDDFFYDNDQPRFIGRVQLMDEDYHVLWSKDLDQDSLRSLSEFRNEMNADLWDEDYSWDFFTAIPPHRQIRSANHKMKKYGVSEKSRFVNCERFKPVTRSRFIVSPSLTALHACYKRGVYLNELETRIRKQEGDQLRYDLVNLYVACEDAFDENIDELTEELKEDYQRCKLTGALNPKQQAIVEKRFAERLASGASDVPSNLQLSTTHRTSLDPRGFVECRHVEMELFEDYMETPSYEALHRCQKLGVTSRELGQGIARNPQPDLLRFDVSSLYVSCQDVFDGNVHYMSNELKEDYRRCKRVGAISKDVQEAVEKRFYETLYEEHGMTEKSAEKSSPLSPQAPTTTTTTTSADYETTTTITSKRPNANRYAFANCKRIENKAYLICIKIIKVFSTPIQYV